ncbi:potassium channel family protein [Caenimonas sedimenti]|nr:potassium channel family protein [Caenimonas sedimenti]
MKALVYVANRMHMILLIYAASLLCAAALFAGFEAKSYWDGLWWAVVTALTIGYGDLAPATVPGRLTGIVFGHLWIFGVIPMIIGNIISSMLEDRNKFTHAEQEWTERTLRRIADKVGVEVDEPPPDY